MVRIHAGAAPIRFDMPRILAFSAAIALHLLALALLLVPLSQVPIRTDALRETPAWTIAVTPPPTPMPVETEVMQPAPPQVVPKTQPPALPTLIETPQLPVYAVEAVIPSSTTQTTEGPTAESNGPSIAPVQPLQGVSLQYLSAPAPSYPRDALRIGAQGTVVLRVLVDENGLPIEVTVERSSGNRSLDNAARAQVTRHWKFRPAIDNGRAVQAYGLIPVDFRTQ